MTEQRIDRPPERTVDTVTAEINTLHAQAQRMMLSYVIEIGRRLIEVKAMVSHGGWGAYLRDRTPYSQSTANNFMQIAAEYGDENLSLFEGEKSQAFGDLTYTQALALLALPRAERAEFAEEHDVAEMSSRQLKEAIRERNEARAEAERLKESARALEDATARLRAAEASRAKMEEDMTLLNERLAGLNEELRLERDRPVVVTDAAPEQLAQARAEGAEEARQAAEQAARKAEQDLEKARERERKAAEQLAQLKDAAEKAEAARAEAEKKAASVERSAASAELARFTVLFGQAQELANQMREILDAMQRNEDRATAERLARALLALAGAIEEAARDGA